MKISTKICTYDLLYYLLMFFPWHNTEYFIDFTYSCIFIYFIYIVHDIMNRPVILKKELFLIRELLSLFLVLYIVSLERD